ncbi:hypothetical protein CBM2592_A280113 [Cupriavidus taiwanensis]|nr:hypothetical protein CBM2592_A280113 [Cupriavidus taiwanensis]SPD44882.1 protein of unknown function [Cupriavidus taiwanensis]
MFPLGPVFLYKVAQLDPFHCIPHGLKLLVTLRNNAWKTTACGAHKSYDKLL